MDIPKELVSFVELVGMDVFIRICEEYGGNQIYFPKKDSLMRGYRDKVIKREYDGTNVSELARRYGLSSNHIRNIVSKK